MTYRLPGKQAALPMIKRLRVFVQTPIICLSALIVLGLVTSCARASPPRLTEVSIKESLMKQGSKGLLEMAAAEGTVRFSLAFLPSETDASSARVSGSCEPVEADYRDLLALIQSHQFSNEPNGMDGNRVELMRQWSDGTSETITFFSGGTQYRAYDDWRRIFSNLVSGRSFNHEMPDRTLQFSSGCK